MIDVIDLKKRTTLRLTSLVAVLATLGPWAVARMLMPRAANPNEKDSSTALLNAMHQRLRQRSPIMIVEAMLDAPTTTLAHYYQLFWPIFIKGDVARQVEALALHCEQRLLSTTLDKKLAHRVCVLPAMASMHALSLGAAADTEELRSRIETIGRFSLRPAGSEAIAHREVLHIFWENMTAALIRNDHTWHSFVAGSELTDQAEQLCDTFLDGEVVLIHAATVAWQFLLTYERALSARRTLEADHERSRVHTAMERVREHRNLTDLPWLFALTKLFENRHSLSEMLPQHLEAIMGRQHYTLAADQLASDYFVLVRLQTIHRNYLLASNVLSSVYTPDGIYKQAGRAADLLRNSPTFLANCGIRPVDWPRLMSSAKALGLRLSRESVAFINDLFKDYDRSFRLSDFELRDKDAVWRGNWKPFREYDERSAFSIYFKSQGVRIHTSADLDEALSAYLGPAVAQARTPSQQIDLLTIPAAFMAQHEAAKRDAASHLRKVLREVEGEAAALGPFYKDEWSELGEIARDLGSSKVVLSRLDTPARREPATRSLPQKTTAEDSVNIDRPIDDGRLKKDQPKSESGALDRSRMVGGTSAPSTERESSMQQIAAPSSHGKSFEHINVAQVTAAFAEYAKSLTPDEVFEILRRYDDDYERAYPKNVLPVRRYGPGA